MDFDTCASFFILCEKRRDGVVCDYYDMFCDYRILRGIIFLMILSIKLAPLNLTKLVLFTREIGIEFKLIGAVNL